MEAPKHHIRGSQGGGFLGLNPHHQLQWGGRHTPCHSLRDGGGECETGPPVGRPPLPAPVPGGSEPGPRCAPAAQAAPQTALPGTPPLPMLPSATASQRHSLPTPTP